MKCCRMVCLSMTTYFLLQFIICSILLAMLPLMRRLLLVKILAELIVSELRLATCSLRCPAPVPPWSGNNADPLRVGDDASQGSSDALQGGAVEEEWAGTRVGAGPARSFKRFEEENCFNFDEQAWEQVKGSIE